jgi:diguanylate cyclase (GGDEF)-like protein
VRGSEASHARRRPPASGRNARLSSADVSRHERADELYRQAREIRQVDYPRLKELAERSMELACEVGSDGEQYRRGMAAALSMLAYHSATVGCAEAALPQVSQALALLDTDEPSVVQRDLKDTLGWARFCQGEFVEAVEALVSARRIAEQLGDRSAAASSVDMMASVHAVSGHPEDAVGEHLFAIETHQQLGDGVNLAITRNNLAYTYLALGDPGSALAVAEQALAYVSEHHHPNLETTVLDTVATAHLALGDLDSADSISRRGLELARRSASTQDVADNLMTLGRIALEQGRYDDALAAMEEALAIASERGRAVQEYTCHEVLAVIHERRGDMARALAEYRLFHRLERSRVNDESEARLAHLRVENHLEAARKDSEIHRLRSLALEREVEEARLAQARLEAQASLDPLTGLYNRRHLLVLAEELVAATARRESACLVLFDIDHFKEVNDTYGHLAGDRVLVEMAERLRSNSRANDVPLRYGGDEFLVLLLGMDAPAGAEAAERLRAAVEAESIESDGAQICVTISAGVICAPLGGAVDLEALIEQADSHLYRAKQAGRNRVVGA